MFSLFSAEGAGGGDSSSRSAHDNCRRGRTENSRSRVEAASRMEGGAEEGESRVQCILFVFRTVFE
jgi:hypothetical protein